ADTSITTDIHDAGHNSVTTVALGSTVHDQAMVSGQVNGFVISGNVSFTFYTSGDCSTGSEAADSATLDGNNPGIAHPSASKGPLAAGSYSFKAHYNGDDNYNGSTSDCEPLTVSKANSSTATEIHDSSHDVVTSVALGATVHDKATVSGISGFTPSGTV